jgi:transcriptional regulator with XRE-family HTH domain
MRWTLKDYLNQHDLTAYQLAKATGLSVNTIYPLARGEAKGIQLETLQTVLDALDDLTGKRVDVSDLLERETSEYEFADDEPVPDEIIERIRRFERGESKLIPWEQVKAEQQAKRRL